jgi:hypothetical protein
VGDLGSSRTAAGVGGSIDIFRLEFDGCEVRKVASELRLGFVGSLDEDKGDPTGANFSGGSPFNVVDGLADKSISPGGSIFGDVEHESEVSKLVTSEGCCTLSSKLSLLWMAAIPRGVSHSSIRNATVPKTFAANDRWSLFPGRSRILYAYSGVDASKSAAVSSLAESFVANSSVCARSFLVDSSRDRGDGACVGFGPGQTLILGDGGEPSGLERWLDVERTLYFAVVSKIKLFNMALGPSLGKRNVGQSPLSGLSRLAK